MFENTAIHILGGYTATRRNFHGNHKNRTHYALSMRLAGESVFSYNGEKRIVKAGDILYLPAYLDYQIDCNYEDVMVVQFQAYHSPGKELFVFSPQDSEYYAEKFRQIIRLTQNALPSSALLATSELYHLLSDIEKEQELTNTSFTPEMRNAVTYLHNHFTDPALNLSVLTDLAAVSDTYFRRMFTSVYQTTPIRYINRLRVDYAYNLLLSGMYTVKEAAEQSGFTDPKYFSRIFKAYMGTSPSDVTLRRS